MSRANQKIGKHGQQQAASILAGMGLQMVEPIGTPVTLLPFGLRRDVFRVIWGEKVSGDRTAIVPGSGRKVLVETKTILERNLRWSDLRTHQPERLYRNSELGGLSLLVWVHESGVYILQWPVPGFKKGKSIGVEKAQKLNIEELSQCR